MKELVNNSDAEKKKWLAKLNELQEATSSIEAFKASDLYAALVSGKLTPPSGDGLREARSQTETIKMMDAFDALSVKHGHAPGRGHLKHGRQKRDS
ncbi:hypothetical protein [Ensifer sp. 4252]|uniref:hypothetical protein n=1 Tax=Ensifer sp. 4252 TaxID=3373915 RepID=UPI003D1F2E7B